MGDKYNRMAILVSNIEQLFSLWYRGQLIVILPRTRIMKILFLLFQIIKKIELKLMLTQNNQWCDYIGEVMNITIVKPNKNSESSVSLNQHCV